MFQTVFALGRVWNTLFFVGMFFKIGRSDQAWFLTKKSANWRFSLLFIFSGWNSGLATGGSSDLLSSVAPSVSTMKRKGIPAPRPLDKSLLSHFHPKKKQQKPCCFSNKTLREVLPSTCRNPYHSPLPAGSRTGICGIIGGADGIPPSASFLGVTSRVNLSWRSSWTI